MISEQPVPGPSIAVSRRRPLWELYLTRGIIAAMVLLVIVEAVAVWGYSLTVTGLEAQLDETVAKNPIVREVELPRLIRGLYWRSVVQAQPPRLVEFRWPSFFKTYLVQVKFNEDEEVLAFSTRGDLDKKSGALNRDRAGMPKNDVPPVAPGTASVLTGSLQQGVLMREVVRQSLLMTAREEFGLPTRDPVLRESATGPDTSDVWPFLVELQIDLEVTQSVSVCRMTPSKRHSIILEDYRDPPEERLPRLLERADQWSTKEFIQALNDAGYRQRHDNARSEEQATIPEYADRMAFAMNPVSQFGVVRALHAELAGKKETPMVRCALARSYALLGNLTEPHWNLAHKAFKARALLSAQRAVRQWPDNAEALATRAFVFALVGLHARAESDLERAKQFSPNDLPPWSRSIDAYCRWDADQLASGNETDKVLVSHLQMLAAEIAGTDGERQAAAQLACKPPQVNWRAFATLAGEPALGLRHQTYQLGFPQFMSELPVLLSELPDLPPAVRQIVEPRLLKARLPENAGLDEMLEKREWNDETEWLGELSSALFHAGATDTDRRDPSWQTLASLIEDAMMVHAISMLDFEKRLLSVDPLPTLSRWRPLIQSHPLASVIEAYGTDLARDPKQLEAVKEKLAALQLSDGAYDLTMALSEPWTIVEVHSRLKRQRDEIVPDYALSARMYASYREIQQNIRRGLSVVAPKCPLYASLGAQLGIPDEDHAPNSMPRPDHPKVLAQQAARYEREERFDEAEKVWLKLKKLSPEAESYWPLISHYKQRGNWPALKQTYIELIQIPSPGLAQAQAAAELAYALMDRQLWEEALPYAEVAAQTYSSWGLLCAADCYEGNGDRERAEQMVRAASERYDTLQGNWYLWCRRTGEGNVEAARLLSDQFLERMATEGDPDEYRLQRAVAWELADDLERAYELDRVGTEALKSPFRPVHRLRAALFAHRLGKMKERDEWLEQLASSRTDHPLPEMVRAFRRAQRQQLPLTDEELNWHVESSWVEGEWTNNCYYLAQLLAMYGEPERAKDWMKRCALSPMRRQMTQALAGVALRNLGEEVPYKSESEFGSKRQPVLAILRNHFVDIKATTTLLTIRFEKAMDAAPDWALPVYAWAKSLRREAQYAKAEQLVSRLLERTPSLPDLYLLRGELRVELRDYAGAIKDFNAGLEIDSEHRLLHEQLAWILLAAPEDDLRDIPLGAEHAAKAAGTASEHRWNELDLQAMLACANGQYDQAIPLAEEAVKLASDEDKFEPNSRLMKYRRSVAYRLPVGKPAE